MNVLKKQQEQISSNERRYRQGLDKLKETEDIVAKLEVTEACHYNSSYYTTSDTDPITSKSDLLNICYHGTVVEHHLSMSTVPFLPLIFASFILFLLHSFRLSFLSHTTIAISCIDEWCCEHVFFSE